MAASASLRYLVSRAKPWGRLPDGWTSHGQILKKTLMTDEKLLRQSLDNLTNGELGRPGVETLSGKNAN